MYYDGVLNAQLGWNVNSAQRFKGGGYMVAGVIVYNYDHLVDHSKNTIVSSPSACLDLILKAQMVTSPSSMYITVFSLVVHPSIVEAAKTNLDSAIKFQN